MAPPDTHFHKNSMRSTALTGSTTSTGGSKYYLFIFNFDGVLADSARIYLDLLRSALAVCGYTRQIPSLEDLVRCERFDGEGLADTFGISVKQRSFFVRYIDTTLARSALSCELYPGIALALRTLSSTANTAIISRSTPEFISTTLRANGVPQAINRLLGIDCGNAVDCIRQLLKELQIAPKRAIYCGDCVHDLHIARLAGVGAAACAWGWQGSDLRYHSRGNHLIFDRPAQMLSSLSSPHRQQLDIVL